jgi:hypothetical protein
VETPLPAVKDVELSRPTVAAVTPERQVTLARPKWVPKIQPRRTPAPVDDETIIDETIAAESPPPVAAAVAPPPSPSPPQPVQDEIGFTLRFESDLALTRLVASGQVGFYAIDAERAQRMAVNDSRISFWDASTPNSFHEMEAKTVPRPVVEALSRTGADAGTVDWGVTLPNRLQSQLNTLMREHTGGALVIGGDGNLNLEAS